MMDQTLELRWWEAVRQQDDRKLFDRLYLGHWEKLYAIAWSRTKDEAVAKDIVQDVFVSFWERRKDITIRTGVGQYLTGALKNRLIDYFQSEQVKQRVFAYVLGQMEAFLRQSDDAWSYQEVEDILEDELEKMPDNMRKSFLLKLDNLSTPDIAKRLNLAEQTVSNLLTEASKRLRKNLPHRFQDNAMPILITFLQVIHDLLTNK
ncbi:sigma-70 family RNA polymerase sigma factor [Parapedobacter koreensis]|uniref:RNA polymerase sigma-70 factor, ECF subfamily n=1 Tax=Parapedobacter koreensis TaxID=332977 RepID=A0A1H7FM19_9SPHI|nr:sigma-70 family RNA polymerase sigma factor [Parapedobacter koreensis]SEK26834.1 RNA polymerase sigma-70 factor, ECF subfamily [Parapedobacter koreensis]